MTNIKKTSKNTNNTKKLKDNVKGVSLIVLIITIIVIIILATAVILSITANNPIDNGSDIEYFSVEKGVNKPLLAGMEPVRWNLSTDGKVMEEDNTVLEASPNWYDYVAGDNSTDSKSSMWANAKTDDGSYWVWIPRYAYRISDKPVTTGNVKGKIEVVFLIDDTDEYIVNGTKYTAKKINDVTITAGDYIVHPAFTFGEKEITGIWVAKYEASHAGAGVAVAGTEAPAVGTSTNIKSVPNVVSWSDITVSDIFDKCYNMRSNSTYGWAVDATIDTHMMKNIEWGAVAYLTHSQYGRNGNEVQINSNQNYITGASGIETIASGSTTLNTATDSTSVSGTFMYNNTYRGVLASTTGNVYGVYDMSGGAYEYVAGNLSRIFR